MTVTPNAPTKIERSDAVLVFIGKSWLASDGGRVRLDEPGDTTTAIMMIATIARATITTASEEWWHGVAKEL